MRAVFEWSFGPPDNVLLLLNFAKVDPKDFGHIAEMFETIFLLEFFCVHAVFEWSFGPPDNVRLMILQTMSKKLFRPVRMIQPRPGIGCACRGHSDEQILDTCKHRF